MQKKLSWSAHAAFFIMLLSTSLVLILAQTTQAAHGISIDGKLKYNADFKQFDYTSEQAKKGGTLVSVKSQDNEGLAEKYGVRFEWFFMWPDGEMLAELGKLISEGSIKTVIDSTFPMNQSAEAFDRLATGRAKGKIVVTVK